jgi:hypothetical protein
MKYFGLLSLIFGLTFYSFSNFNPEPDKSENQTKGLGATEVSKNKKEIQELIRQVMIWSDSKESIKLLPALPDVNNKVYVGFDINKHTANLKKLKETSFFANEFIENYNQIILTLDKKLRNKEIKEWQVGDLPTFNFVNDVSPWCLCQGFSSEDFDDVEIVKLDRQFGELKWKWKKGSSWNDFRFRVVKDGNKWKVSYMEGFDFKESIK